MRCVQLERVGEEEGAVHNTSLLSVTTGRETPPATAHQPPSSHSYIHQILSPPNIHWYLTSFPKIFEVSAVWVKNLSSKVPNLLPTTNILSAHVIFSHTVCVLHNKSKMHSWVRNIMIARLAGEEIKMLGN